jgi:hypothetical protein
MAFLRRAGIILIVVVVAVGLGGPAAGAKKKKVRKWGSQVTLTHPSSTQFAGVASSKLKACRQGRQAVLYYTDPITGQTQPLSVQRTNSKGRYEVNLPSPAYAGNYQTQLIKQRIRAQKAPQICRGAQSPVFTV